MGISYPLIVLMFMIDAKRLDNTLDWIPKSRLNPFGNTTILFSCESFCWWRNRLHRTVLIFTKLEKLNCVVNRRLEVHGQADLPSGEGFVCWTEKKPSLTPGLAAISNVIARRHKTWQNPGGSSFGWKWCFTEEEQYPLHIRGFHECSWIVASFEHVWTDGQF